MGEKKVVEVIYGKYNKYEIVKDPGGFIGPGKFYIHRDGKPHRGSFSSLREAVEAAEKEG